MKINSILWHKENLKNMSIYYNNQNKILQNKIEENLRTKRNIDLLNYQIQEAEKMKKESFDSDKFRIKKIVR